MQTTTTVAPKQRKPRAKPARHVRLVVEPTADESGVLIITVGKLMTPYFIDRIPEAYGVAFSLQKFHGDHYDVNLGDPAEGIAPSCDCPGFLQWGFRGPCKHLAGIQALVDAGAL